MADTDVLDPITDAQSEAQQSVTPLIDEQEARLLRSHIKSLHPSVTNLSRLQFFVHELFNAFDSGKFVPDQDVIIATTETTADGKEFSSTTVLPTLSMASEAINEAAREALSERLTLADTLHLIDEIAQRLHTFPELNEKDALKTTLRYYFPESPDTYRHLREWGRPSEWNISTDTGTTQELIFDATALEANTAEIISLLVILNEILEAITGETDEEQTEDAEATARETMDVPDDAEVLDTAHTYAVAAAEASDGADGGEDDVADEDTIEDDEQVEEQPPLPQSAVINPFQVGLPLDQIPATQSLDELRDFMRSANYETQWIYGRLIFELESAGVELDFATRDQLRRMVLNQLTAEDVAALYANPTGRLRVLAKIRRQILQTPLAAPFAEALVSQGVGTSTGQLTQGLAGILGYDSTEDAGSLTIAANALLSTYGTDALSLFDGTRLDFSKPVDRQKLVALLNLSSQTVLTQAQAEQLAQLVLGYLNIRVLDTVLTTQSDEVQGMLALDQADAAALSAASYSGFANHFTANHPLEQIKEASKTSGPENYQRALTTTPKHIEKQFQALWHSLSLRDQKIIYGFYNVAIPANVDADPSKKLPIIQEISQFNIGWLKTFDQAIKEQPTPKEINDYFSDLQNLHQVMVAQSEITMAYLLALDVEKRNLLAQALYEEQQAQLASQLQYVQAQIAAGVELEGEQQMLEAQMSALVSGGPSAMNLRGYAPAQLATADSQASAVSGASSVAGARQRATNSALENKIQKAAKLAQKYGGTWGKLGGYAAEYLGTTEGRKKLQKILAGAAAGGLGLWLLLSKLGGAIRGAMGGVLTGAGIGGVVGTFILPGIGTAAGVFIGGAIGGAVGSGAMSGLFQSASGGGASAAGGTGAFSSSSLGGTSSAAAGGAGAAGTTTATTTSLTATAAIPLIGVLSLSVIVFHVFLVIYGAFLVPSPTNTGSLGSSIYGGVAACWPTTGTLKGMRVYPNGNPHLTWRSTFVSPDGRRFSGPGTAIDIIAPAGTEIYTPFSGTAYFYSQTKGLSEDYGHHVLVVTDDFALIFAHMIKTAQSAGTYAVPVRAGELIGYVGSTGNSDANHLHYEAIGIDVINIVPFTSEQKAQVSVDESKLYNLPVSATECAVQEGEDDEAAEGYIAIGPAVESNIVASSADEITAGSSLTCDWWRSKTTLTAAINANYYNDGGTRKIPVGLAGFGSTDDSIQYYADPTSDTGVFDLSLLHSIIIDTNNQVRWTQTNPDQRGKLAITGLWAEGKSESDDAQQAKQRTVAAIGIDNGTCAGDTYTGQRVVYLATFKASSVDAAEARIKSCGATQVLHLDGGGSTAFCSSLYSQPTTRAVPVHFGIKEATVSAF